MQKQSTQSSDHHNILRLYQASIAAIYKQRRRILSQISDKQKDKQFFSLQQNSSKTNLFSSFKSQTQIHDQPRKLLKTQSTKSIEEDNTPKSQSKIQPGQQTKKTEEKPTAVPQAIADRNRRIFGGLTSYLKKAGQHLQSKAQKEKQQNTKEILNKFISKEKQQREEREQKKREDIEFQLTKLQEEKKQNEEKMNKTENEMLSFIVKSHFNALGNFNLTKAEPKIFWKPRKPLQDQQKIERIRMYTEKQLKRQEEQLVERVMGFNEVFDHGKYMTQNQRQFYSSFIKNLYRDHKSCIMTRTEPTIFWRPKKSFKDLEGLLSETSMRLDEKSAGLNNTNLEYYKSRQTNLIEEHNNDFLDQDHEDDQEKDQ